jgi:hypothetical protein
MKVVLYVQGIHLDPGESCLVRTGNSFRSGLVVLYVQGIHLDPGESCLVRTGNSFRSG